MKARFGMKAFYCGICGPINGLELGAKLPRKTLAKASSTTDVIKEEKTVVQ